MKVETKEALNSMDDIWSRTMRNLRSTTRRAVMDSWFQPITQLKVDHNTIELGVPDAHFLDHVQAHYLDRISASINHVAAHPMQLVFKIVTPKNAPSGQQKTNTRGQDHRAQQGMLPLNNEAPLKLPAAPPNGLLNSLNFEHFVKGPSNELAYGAALAVSETPNAVFNPLFLYGGVGIGKTHLLHAIGNAIIDQHPSWRVLYVPSANFIDDTITAMRSKSTTARVEVRNRYRDIDLLLIDDIQFMQHKEKTQEEFFHTFNALRQAGKQIVLTSDRFPSELNGFQDRLRSRFAWGLVAEIRAPDRQMRIDILLNKAQEAGLELPLDVVHYLADHLRNNVRELEGALNKLKAHSHVKRQTIDMSLTRQALGPIIELPSHNLTIDAIQRVTAKHFALRVPDLKGNKRNRTVVVPRMIAMYLARKHTQSSYPEIGQAFGGRDHSTVINANKRIDWKIQHDQDIQTKVAQLEQLLGR